MHPYFRKSPHFYFTVYIVAGLGVGVESCKIVLPRGQFLFFYSEAIAVGCVASKATMHSITDIWTDIQTTVSCQ